MSLSGAREVKVVRILLQGIVEDMIPLDIWEADNEGYFLLDLSPLTILLKGSGFSCNIPASSFTVYFY